MAPSDNEITDMEFRRMITKIFRDLQKDKSRYKNKFKEDRNESTKWMNNENINTWMRQGNLCKDVKIQLGMRDLEPSSQVVELWQLFVSVVEYVFFKDVPSRLTSLQWVAPHTWICLEYK